MNEENVTHVTNAVENAVTHCVGATDITETAVSSAKNLTLGGIGIGVGWCTMAGVLFTAELSCISCWTEKSRSTKTEKRLLTSTTVM